MIDYMFISPLSESLGFAFVLVFNVCCEILSCDFIRDFREMFTSTLESCFFVHFLLLLFCFLEISAVVLRTQELFLIIPIFKINFTSISTTDKVNFLAIFLQKLLKTLDFLSSF